MDALRANLLTIVAMAGAAALTAAVVMVAYAAGPGAALALPAALVVGVAVWQRPLLGPCFALLAVPLEERVAFTVGIGGLSPTELVLVMTAGVVLAHAVLGDSLRPISRAHVAFGALLLVIVSGVAFAEDTVIIFKTALMWGSFLVVSIAMAKAPPRDIALVLGAIVVAGALLGFNAATAGVDQQLLRGGAAATGRATATFTQPNLLGFFLVLAIPPAIVLAARGTAIRRSLMLVAALFAIVGLVLTLSRSSILGATTSLLVLLAWPAFRRVAGVTLVAILAIGLLNFEAIESSPQVSVVGTRLGTLADPQSRGSDPRFEIWDTGREIASDHPFLGTGYGNFPVVSPRYGLLEPGGHEYEHAHNLWLTVAAELGMLGLACLLAMMLSTAREARAGLRRRAAPSWPLLVGVTASMAGLLVVALGDYPLGNNAVMATVMIEVGALIGLSRAARAETASAGAGDLPAAPDDGDPD